jgi:hypothetical protein
VCEHVDVCCVICAAQYWDGRHSGQGEVKMGDVAPGDTKPFNSCVCVRVCARVRVMCEITHDVPDTRITNGLQRLAQLL